MIDYFFSGEQYIRVSRGNTGPGAVNPGYPAPISNWGWGAFGRKGIDAALYSGSKCYFFAGNQYIRVTRGVLWPGTVDAGYPAPISDWGWGAFGASGIDAALNSGAKCYFFSGNRYIRVTRGETDLGTVDPGYPAPISNWGWGNFGAQGIDAALYSGSKCYFFLGNRYVRVSRADIWPGLLDKGYPAPISNWGWGAFGASGIDAALFSGGPLATPPTTGLGSCTNYFLVNSSTSGSNWTAMMGVSMVINADADVIGSNGFGFQLNCYSPNNYTCGWQQYVIVLDPNSNQVHAAVNNWKTDGTILINNWVNLAKMPGNKLPAGYQLMIALGNDSSGNISGATFSVADQNGKTVGSQMLTLTSLDRSGGGKVTSGDLAPIVALTLDFVGPYNSQTTNITSGVGTMTYSAAEPMTVLSSVPASAECGNWFTNETSNSRFGMMPAAPDQNFTQSFQFEPETTHALIRRVGGIGRTLLRK